MCNISNVSSLLSIIIPIYNVEDYISKCIESILSQSYKDFELILINDGSTDRSGEICKEYAEKDKRIELIHQANCGVSAARNLGLRVSKGDYIIFVDGDDLLCEGSLFDLSQRIKEKEHDLIIMNSYTISENKLEEYKPFPKEYSQKAYTGYQVFEFYERTSVCGIAFRREFILQNDIWFTTRMKNSEDSLFFSMCLMYAQSIIHYPIDFYKVNERQGSASRSWTFDRVMDMTKGFDEIQEIIEKREISPKLQAILYAEAYFLLSYLLLQFIKLRNIKGYFALRRKIKSSPIFPINLNAIHTKKMKIRLLNISYDLYFCCLWVMLKTIWRKYYV